MQIIRGKDGADLLPPGKYTPKPDTTETPYEFWVMQMAISNAADKLAAAIKPLLDAMNKVVNTLPDETALARQRSRDDLKRKRAELRQRRGKLF